jgi:uncharacterized membrane protein YoaK (UPF0700 family)
MNAFLADMRKTIVPDRHGQNGPLPPLLISMTLVTGLVDAFSYLVLGHVFVANMTGNIVLLGFAASVIVAAFSSSPLTAGHRYPLIVVLGAAMGIQNAAARKIAVPDLTTTVLTLTITGIAADSALAGGPGSKAGSRLVPVVTMLAGALVGAVLVRHAPIFYPLAIALVTVVLGSVTSHVLGRSAPAWVRTGV